MRAYESFKQWSCGMPIRDAVRQRYWTTSPAVRRPIAPERNSSHPPTDLESSFVAAEARSVAVKPALASIRDFTSILDPVESRGARCVVGFRASGREWSSVLCAGSRDRRSSSSHEGLNYRVHDKSLRPGRPRRCVIRQPF